MRSYLANASWSTPQGETPFETGAKWGQVVSNIGNAAAQIGKEIKSDKNKVQIDTLIQQYNSGTGVFAGIEPASLRTEKLARLLIPLDEKLAARYAQRATEEKALETKTGQAKSVSEAYRRAPTEAPVEGIDGASIDAEIKAIEARLKLLASGVGYTQEGESPYIPMLPDFNGPSIIGDSFKLPGRA